MSALDALSIDKRSDERGQDEPSLREEISELEARLHAARLRLHPYVNGHPTAPLIKTPAIADDTIITSSTGHLHALLLLSDSALPLGSFAYSSSLESFLAHHPRSATSAPPSSQLQHFLALSLNSITATTLPYVIAGYSNPKDLVDLDNDLDASTPCTVARRASVKQGLALLAVWERSFRAGYRKNPTHTKDSLAAAEELATFSGLLKASSLLPYETQDEMSSIFAPNGHLPPLFGALCATLAIPLGEALYLYLLNHSKTIISAAIRAGVLGPYQAQGFLAGEDLRGRIGAIVDRELGTQKYGRAIEGFGIHAQAKAKTAKDATALAGQSVPALDLWGGRHEIIYSRIFNS